MPVLGPLALARALVLVLVRPRPLLRPRALVLLLVRLVAGQAILADLQVRGVNGR